MMESTLFRRCVHRWAPLLVALVALLSTARTLSACPTCSDAIAANDPEHDHMVKGYSYSILFMMGAPYTVFMCFAGYMYWEVKKARARRAAEVPRAASNSQMPLAPASAAIQPDLAETSPPDAANTHELVEA